MTSTPGAELQTLDTSVGNAIGGDTLLMVPTLRPQQGSTQNSTLGGQVAGAHSDQNAIVLDGGVSPTARQAITMVLEQASPAIGA